MLLTDWLYGIVYLTFFGCLLLTRRLRSDDPITTGDHGNVVGPGAAIAGASAFILLFVAMFFAPIQPLVLALVMLALALHVRALSHGRRAARGLVGAAVHTTITGIVMLSITVKMAFRLPIPEAYWIMPVYVALLLVILTTNRWMYRLDASPGGKKSALALWVLFLVGSLLGAINATLYGNDAQLRTFVTDFDDRVEQIGDWQEFGVAQLWLRASGNAPEITNRNERIRKALEDGTHMHPRTLKGAMDAGLMDDAMWAAYRADWDVNERRYLLSEPLRTFIWTQDKPLELRAFLRDPQTTPEERRTIIGRVANSWPIERGIGNLEKAREVADLLVELGRKDLVLEERAALHELLQQSWCGGAAWHASPGGFSAYNEGCRRGWSDSEATLDAVRLMTHVGVPEGIDLTKLDRHLQARLRPSVIQRPFAIWDLDVETVIARRFLHHDHGAALAAENTPWRHMPIVAWFLPGLLGLILIFRAPNVEIRRAEDGEG